MTGINDSFFRFHYSIFRYYLFRLVLNEFFLQLIISREQVKIMRLIILQSVRVEINSLILAITGFEGLAVMYECQRISDLLANIDRLFSDQGTHLSERLGRQIEFF